MHFPRLIPLGCRAYPLLVGLRVARFGAGWTLYHGGPRSRSGLADSARPQAGLEARFDLVDPPAANQSGFPKLRFVAGIFLLSRHRLQQSCDGSRIHLGLFVSFRATPGIRLRVGSVSTALRYHARDFVPRRLTLNSPIPTGERGIYSNFSIRTGA